MQQSEDNGMISKQDVDTSCAIAGHHLNGENWLNSPWLWSLRSETPQLFLNKEFMMKF